MRQTQRMCHGSTCVVAAAAAPGIVSPVPPARTAYMSAGTPSVAKICALQVCVSEMRLIRFGCNIAALARCSCVQEHITCHTAWSTRNVDSPDHVSRAPRRLKAGCCRVPPAGAGQRTDVGLWPCQLQRLPTTSSPDAQARSARQSTRRITLSRCRASGQLCARYISQQCR